MDNPGHYSGDEADAVILAAGASQRMGTPKAFLPFGGDENFIQKLVRTYINWGCSKVVIVTGADTFTTTINAFKEKRIKVVENSSPESGRFYSMQLGLHNSKAPYVFVQNVDNPFTCHCWLSKLFDNRSPGCWTAPEYKGKRGHPVLLGGEVVQNLLKKISGNEFLRSGEPEKWRNGSMEGCKKNDSLILPFFHSSTLPYYQASEILLKEELRKYPSINVSISDPAILININTPWDYEKYFRCTPAEPVIL